MATYYQRGEAIDYVNSGNSTIEAGTVVVLGKKIGVAGCDIAAGATGSLHVEGVFEFPKGSAAIDAGANVTWSGTAMATTSSGDVHGYAIAAAAASATTVLVKINA